MSMTQEEMIDKLSLTPEQLKLYKKFYKVYQACLSANMEFIGFDDSVFVVNNTHLLGQSNDDEDYGWREENVFEFNEHQTYFQSFDMNEHYASCSVRLKVEE